MAINYTIQPKFKLPASVRENYDELKYIEVKTTTPYINTGIKMTSTIEFELKCRFTQTGVYNVVLSAVIDNAQTIVAVDKIRVAEGRVYEQNFIQKDVKVALVGSNILVNDTPLGTKGSGYSNTNIELMRYSVGGNTNIYGYVGTRLYYCKISDNGSIVRDFVPAKRKSDNVLGLYDLVSNTFFTNAGSGTFLGGEVIKDYVEVENATFNGTALDKVIFNGVTVFENWKHNPLGTLYKKTEVGANSGGYCEAYIYFSKPTKVIHVKGYSDFAGGENFNSNMEIRIWSLDGKYNDYKIRDWSQTTRTSWSWTLPEKYQNVELSKIRYAWTLPNVAHGVEFWVDDYYQKG